MSLLFGEQLIGNGRHYKDTGMDFGPCYLHQLRGGIGPAPKTQVLSPTAAPGTAKKSRYECEMDRARNKANKRHQSGVTA